ncbi:MAG: hypothetical protein OXF84_08325 [Bacteroidetes bacterium]|nr:hypothetical protein [Bacteroidota bacterium]
MILLLLLIQVSSLGESLTFHAPFDSTFEAGFAMGDPVLYQADNLDDSDRAVPADPSESEVSIVVDGGMFGGALHFSDYTDATYFFKGMDNVAYQEEDWNATISFWLKVDPNEDLTEGEWSDPIMLTPRSWDDASVFVDFTRNQPRKFRLAAFADRYIWNPEGDPWEDMASGVMPMITIDDHPFSSESWTHVVMVVRKFNTDADTAVFQGYLNGELVGELHGRDQKLTWDASKVLLSLGLQYRGQMDDLSFFNKDLSPDEVRQLYTLSGGIQTLYQ